ncbi:MAG: ABC transporter ATP-binding protein [Thermomicrobiales bacterium]
MVATTQGRHQWTWQGETMRQAAAEADTTRRGAIGPDAAVVVKDVVKRYGDFTALDHVSLEIMQGEIFGIIGPNGAGKSTLVNIIAGLKDQTGGSVRVLGHDPQGNQHALREEVGIQLQEAQLQDLITVEEAMRLYASFYKNPNPWEPLLVQWNLDEKRKTRFGQLSGGQKQRLFIALALINRPKLVILDELTTGLDPQARRESWALVERIRDEGATVILVTHFMEEAELLCDRIAVVDRGVIRAVGTPESLASPQDDSLRLRFSADASFDTALLEHAPGVTSVERQGHEIVVRGEGFLMATVATVLADHDLNPRDLRMDVPSLEDVFIRLTGDQVRD